MFAPKVAIQTKTARNSAERPTHHGSASATRRDDRSLDDEAAPHQRSSGNPVPTWQTVSDIVDEPGNENEQRTSHESRWCARQRYTWQHYSEPPASWPFDAETSCLSDFLAAVQEVIRRAEPNFGIVYSTRLTIDMDL